MSSQLQDYFEEAVETVARLLYARNRTPREPGWMDLEPQMREGAIRDARVVIDLWIKVSSPCLWCRGTGRTADHHPCTVCGGVGFQRFNADRPEGCRAPHCWSEYGTPCGTCPVEKSETPADREKPDEECVPGRWCIDCQRFHVAPPVSDDPKEKP